MSPNPYTCPSQAEDALISWNKQSFIFETYSFPEFEGRYYGGIVLIPCRDHCHSLRLLLRLRGIFKQDDNIYEVA